MSALKRIRTAAILITPLLVLLFIFLSLQILISPGVVPADASPEMFSAERAAAHLLEIAREPHPIGTPANTRVRDYIISQLEQLGLQPELQREFVTAPSFLPLTMRGVVAGTVENIAARLEGTEGSAAVLLVAHYDSVPNAPGASDDGHAVASLLETARALQASSPLRNDIIFLLTDGEEVGLLGAKAFVEKHPWAQDVALVLNFEARGTNGPVAMFETSSGNDRIMSEFAAAAELPLAYSLIYNLYKLLPNDTDLSVFKEAGFHGFNFAYAHNPQNYHTALDNIENSDPRSLQHAGSYALTLAGHFGEIDLKSLESGGDAVYFTLFRSVLVRYPQGWNLPLTIAALLMVAGALVTGLRCRALTFGRLLLGFALFPAALAVAAITVNLFWRMVGLLAADPMILVTPSYNIYLLFGLLAFTAAVFSALYLLFRRKISPTELTAGALIFWALLTVLTAVVLPGGHYLFVWPLLFAALGLLVIFLAGKQDLSSPGPAAAFTMAALPAVLLVVPVLAILYMMLSLFLPEVIALVFALLLGFFIPWITLPSGNKGWLVPLLPAVLALILIGGALINAAVNPTQPEFNSLIFGYDADSSETRWISMDSQTDSWTGQFIPEPLLERLDKFFPAVTGERMYGPAPALLPESPEAILVVEAATSRGRVLTLNLAKPGGAALLELYLLNEVGVTKAEVNGEPVTDFFTIPVGRSMDSELVFGETAITPYRYWRFRYFALPEEGIDLILHLDSAQPVQVRLVSFDYALPSLPGYDYTRPEQMAPHPESDYTIVTRSYTF